MVTSPEEKYIKLVHIFFVSNKLLTYVKAAMAEWSNALLFLNRICSPILYGCRFESCRVHPAPLLHPPFPHYPPPPNLWLALATSG